MSQGKTIYAQCAEVREVKTIWAAETEKRGTTIASSDWEVTGSLGLGAESLSGTTATALVTVNGCGTIKNTVTLANGEVLTQWRHIEAWEPR